MVFQIGPIFFVYGWKGVKGWMLSRDQMIEIESTRLWRKGFKIRKVTSKLMAKYALERDEAKDFATTGRDIYLGKIIPDRAEGPRLGPKNVKGITPRKSSQE